jgi:predicted small metal-binding protein
MSKVLECRSVVPGCNFVIHGESEEDVMMKEEEHAHRVHGVEHISEQLKAKIRSAIKEQ